MSAETFQFDVFLSHSSKDKAVVRGSSLSASNGERAGVRCRSSLRKDGRKVWWNFGLWISDFGFAQPGLSAHAFGSDWAQLEAGTCGRGNLPFRDPLNQERRFIPLRLDDAPSNGF